MISDSDLLTVDYLMFQLGSERYALPTTSVREVARHQALTPVPGTPPELPGIISRHGTILAVIDPRPLLGLPPGKPTRASRLLTAAYDGFELALIADGVFDLVALPAGAFGPLPTTLDPARARLISGITSHQNQPLALLDLSALVSVVCEGS